MINFIKMHGLGNDFVIVDAREATLPISLAEQPATSELVCTMSDRHTGVGCDQFIILQSPKVQDGQHHSATAYMQIFNADGSFAEACGNAARCVARLLMDQTQSDQVVLETPVGPVFAEWQGHEIAVNMGAPGLLSSEIPLTDPLIDPSALPISLEAPLNGKGEARLHLSQPHAVSIGNPHLVFFTADSAVESLDLAAIGPELTHHPLFPNGTNVEIVFVRPDGSLRLRVYERGAGITRACGSGACAARVAAACRGLSPRSGPIDLDGGRLYVDWCEQGDIIMHGPASYSFEGVWPGPNVEGQTIGASRPSS